MPLASEISDVSQVSQVSHVTQLSQLSQLSYRAQPRNLSQKSRAYYSTFRRPQELNHAMLELYLKQAPILLQTIQAKFSDPEIRTGLSIKILHNTPPGTRLELSILQPILNDIETLIKDRQALKATGNAGIRLSCLRKEHEFVQRYLDLDDTVSLNSSRPNNGAETDQVEATDETDQVEATDETDQVEATDETDQVEPNENENENDQVEPLDETAEAIEPNETSQDEPVDDFCCLM